jgi:hypothetical protein
VLNEPTVALEQLLQKLIGGQSLYVGRAATERCDGESNQKSDKRD